MDESGIEPETSPMLRERATDYATRPIFFCLLCFRMGYVSMIIIILNVLKLHMKQPYSKTNRMSNMR